MNRNNQKLVVKMEDFDHGKKKIIRSEIWRFARGMEEAMKREDGPRIDSWKLKPECVLTGRIAANLLDFMNTKNRKHLVDLANYAMMLHHKSGAPAGGSNGKTGN